MASGLKIKKNGNVLISVSELDKLEIIPIAQDLEKLGFNIFATTHTAHVLNSNLIATNMVKNTGEGENSAISMIQSGKVDIIINTPSRKKLIEGDGFRIRRMAVERSIPCFTSLDTITAAIKTLKMGKKEQDLEMIDINQV